MSTVIEARGVSKQYRLGEAGGRAETFIGSLRQTFLAPLINYRKIRNMAREGKEDENIFWALKDVSFNVQQGEVVGIVGRNGAGKSTLLKIFSQITEPTRGEVKITGRIASLLEVGTGFHPELTGKENVYMNGTILGMSRKEIDRKFDEIVDFSGIEKFMNTPVKFYSSGMKVRLGFAVAAHLDPEILIVDEVLSVGDAEFQRKAIGKMQDVTREEGRTVLFVSHNLRAVSQLCTKAIVLQNGTLNFEGDVSEAVRRYIHGESSGQNEGVHYFKQTDGNRLGLIKASLLDETGNVSTRFTSRDKAVFQVDFEVRETLRGARIGIQVENQENVVVFTTTNAAAMAEELTPGKYATKCEIPIYLLNEGDYAIRIFAGIPGFEVLLQPVNIMSFTQNYLEPRGTLLNERWEGTIVPPVDWQIFRN